jgi:EmrB/QacA subfamily drug resistance transporter
MYVAARVQRVAASDAPVVGATVSGTAPPARSGGLTFVLTALGAFVTSLDLSIVNVAFPAISRSFAGTSAAGLAWVLTGYSIVFGSLLVVGGRTADRLGRRMTFFVGLGVFGFGSALCGLAPSVVLLVGGRLLQGAGAAFTLPASLGLLLSAFPGERRSQMVALWSGIGALAVATGPSLGALLITEWGWRLVFYVNVPLCVATIVVGRLVLVEVKHPSSHRVDYLGVGLLSGALATLVLAISEGGTWGWGDPRTLGGFVASALLFPAFVRRCRHQPEPIVDLTLFRSRTLLLADAATAVYATGFFAMLLGNILFLTGVWHWSILDAGLAVTPSPIVVTIIAGQAGKIANRIGFRPVLIVGSVFFAGALTWYTLRVGPHPAYLTEWLPGTILAGIGIGLTFPVLGAASVSSLPAERFAVGSALNQTARQVGGAIGIAILVAIIGRSRGPGALEAFRHLWMFEGLAAIATGVIVSGIRRRSSAPA